MLLVLAGVIGVAMWEPWGVALPSSRTRPHLRSPPAAEAAVECVALQRVRDLFDSAGRAPAYAELMAGLAWEVGYPHMPPDYQTAACRDGRRREKAARGRLLRDTERAST